MVTRSKNGVFKPKSYSAAIIQEPKPVKAALSDPKWRASMEEEFAALIKNCTWSLVSLPANRQAIGCKWVFLIKQDPDGFILKFKARLVAKGYSQQEGFDFHELFPLWSSYLLSGLF